jgi:hypothetical protein
LLSSPFLPFALKPRHPFSAYHWSQLTDLIHTVVSLRGCSQYRLFMELFCIFCLLEKVKKFWVNRSSLHLFPFPNHSVLIPQAKDY